MWRTSDDRGRGGHQRRCRRRRPFVDTALEDDLRLVDLNVRSTVHLANCWCGPMVRRGQGRVLVTASIAATAPGPFHATYAASKAFVHSFAEGIRYELKDTGVSVTSLMPGPTDTDFFDRADMNDTKVGQGSKDDPDEVAKDGFDALMSGRASVVAGSFSNRVQAEVSTHLPDTAAAAAQSRMTAPGSGGDDEIRDRGRAASVTDKQRRGGPPADPADRGRSSRRPAGGAASCPRR